MPDFDLNAALQEAPYTGPVFRNRRTLDLETWLRSQPADKVERPQFITWND